MSKIYLEYNPYKLKTVFKRNGKAPKESSYFNDKVNKEIRLQEWIENFPQKVHEEVNENKIEVDFKGTKMDFEDLERVCNKYSKCEFVLQNTYEVDTLQKEKQIEEIYEKIMNGPMEELKNEKLLSKFQKSIKNTLEINLLATMSAGKSTVLNALMNKEILPSENRACTAALFKILNNGDANFRADIMGNNTIIESYLETDKRSLVDKLREVNNSDYIEANDIEEVRIFGRIPFINNKNDNLILIDTPGPNNANNEAHKMVTYKMINESDKDLVLYIMDGTTISSNDSNELLSTIADSMASGGLQSRDRIIFVVNKLDNLREDENIDDILIEVRKLLANHNILEPNIYPISGLSALYLRNLVKDYDGDIDELKLFKDKKFKELELINKFNSNIHLEEYSSLNGSGEDNIQRELTDAKQNGDAVSEAIIHTGIRSLEEAINQYLNKYFKTDKIRNTIMALERKIQSDELDNNLKQQIALKKDTQDNIRNSIIKLKGEKNSADMAKKFGAKIDSINLKDNFNEIGEQAQEKLSIWQINYINENKNKKINVNTAKKEAKKKEMLISKMEKKSLIEVEKKIKNILVKNSKDIIENYKIYLRDVSKQLSYSKINFDMGGILEYKIKNEQDSLIDKIIEEESYEEEVVVGERRYINSNRKWYKPWTLFTEDKYYYEDIIETQEFVNLGDILGKMMDPLEKSFDDNINRMINNALSKELEIKRESKKTLAKLEKILDSKLEEINSLVSEDINNAELLNSLNKQQEYLENLKSACESVVSL